MPEHGLAGAVVYLSESLCSGSNPTGRQRNSSLLRWLCPNLILYVTLTPLSRDESVFDGCLIDTAIDPTTDHHPRIASIYRPLSVLSQQLPVICSPTSGNIMSVHLRWWERGEIGNQWCAGMGFQFRRKSHCLATRLDKSESVSL